MKGFVLIAAISFSSLSMAASYGEPLGKSVQKTSIGQLSGIKPDQNVEVEGTVKKLCKKKGCWMVLESGGEQVRVTFKDYSFFVPAKLTGQKVQAQGNVKVKVLSVAHQKHLLEDGGASQKEINAITKDKLELSFVASWVNTL